MNEVALERTSHKSKFLQDAVSQPGAGRLRGRNVEKNFTKKLSGSNSVQWREARYLSLVKKSLGDGLSNGLGGRPGEEVRH